MKKLVLLAAAVILATASPAFALYTEFKATVVECDNGEKTESKVWITNSKSRRDFKAGKEIVVTRNDLKLTWFIYPEIRRYVETPALGTFANFEMPSENANTGDLKRKFLCYEERDGFRLKKFLVTIKYSNMPGEDKYYEWTRNDFPIPVRTESLDGSSWTEYKNISRGPITQDLFNKPNSYKQATAEEAEQLLNTLDAKKQERRSKRGSGQNSDTEIPEEQDKAADKTNKNTSQSSQSSQNTQNTDMPIVETDALWKLMNKE